MLHLRLMGSFGLTLLLAGSAGAAINIAPSDSQRNWSFFRFQDKCSKDICDVLTGMLMSQTSRQPNICRLLPEASPRDFSFPTWATEDYRRHIDRIKADVMGGFFGNEPLTRSMRQRYPSDSIEDIRQRIWNRYGDEIRALFAKEDAVYQTAGFDIDSDQIPEKLYRVSHVEPVDTARGFIWRVRTCDAARMLPQFDVYLDTDVPPAAGSYLAELSHAISVQVTDYFKFRSVSYQMSASENDALVYEVWRTPDKRYVLSGMRWGGAISQARIRSGEKNEAWPRGGSTNSKVASHP